MLSCLPDRGDPNSAPTDIATKNTRASRRCYSTMKVPVGCLGSSQSFSNPLRTSSSDNCKPSSLKSSSTLPTTTFSDPTSQNLSTKRRYELARCVVFPFPCPFSFACLSSLSVSGLFSILCNSKRLRGEMGRQFWITTLSSLRRAVSCYECMESKRKKL